MTAGAVLRQSAPLAVGAGRLRWIHWIVALWLVGFWFAPTFPPPMGTYAQVVALGWIIPVGLWKWGGNFVVGPGFRQDRVLLFLTTVFLVCGAISSGLSEDPVFTLGMLCALGIGLMICCGLWEVLRGSAEMALAAYAVIGTALTLWFYVGRNVREVRFGGMLHPNTWGLICLGLAGCAMTIRNRWGRLALVTANGFIILKAQSRSAFLGLIAMLVVHYLIGTIGASRGTRANWGLRVWLLLAGMAFVVADPTGHVEQAITAAFNLTDTSRGLETGIGKRFDVWRETLEVFSQNPMWGAGVRMHEKSLTSLSSAHNGYLAVLADLGLVGGLALFGLMSYGGMRLIRLRHRPFPNARLGIALMAGYLCLAVFEARLLNVGNPTSILVWFFLLAPQYEPSNQAPGKARGWPVRAME